MITAKYIDTKLKELDGKYASVVDEAITNCLEDMFVKSYPIREVSIETDFVDVPEGVFIQLMRKRGFDIVAYTSNGMPKFRAYKITVPPQGE